MNYYGAVQTSRDLLSRRRVQGRCGPTQKWYANNARVDTHVHVDRQEASANAHNRSRSMNGRGHAE